MTGEGFLTYPLRDGPRLFRILSPWRSVGSTSLPLTMGDRAGRGSDLIGTCSLALQCSVRPARSTVLAIPAIDRNE